MRAEHFSCDYKLLLQKVTFRICLAFMVLGSALQRYLITENQWNNLKAAYIFKNNLLMLEHAKGIFGSKLKYFRPNRKLVEYFPAEAYATDATDVLNSS